MRLLDSSIICPEPFVHTFCGRQCPRMLTVPLPDNSVYDERPAHRWAPRADTSPLSRFCDCHCISLKLVLANHSVLATCSLAFMARLRLNRSGTRVCVVGSCFLIFASPVLQEKSCVQTAFSRPHRSRFRHDSLARRPPRRLAGTKKVPSNEPALGPVIVLTAYPCKLYSLAWKLFWSLAPCTASHGPNKCAKSRKSSWTTYSRRAAPRLMVKYSQKHSM